MFKKGNLIKKLIVTSIVILSTGNIIASENDNNNPIANNNQLLQNNNLANTGTTLNVNEINDILKTAGIDINDCIKLMMTNPFMLKDKLSNVGCDISELKQLLNPTLLGNYIAFGNCNINIFDLLKTSVIHDGIKSIMVSSEASMLVKAFIDNNDTSNNTTNAFKAFLEKDDVTNELFLTYTKQNIQSIIASCNKANIIIPKANTNSIYSVTSSLFNELNKTNDINDYAKKYCNLLVSVIVDKSIAIDNIFSNISKIQSMEKKDKDKLKDYLLHKFITLLEKNDNILNYLDKEINDIKEFIKTIKSNQYFKANMSNSQIEEFNKFMNLCIDIDKQEVTYRKGIQEVAKAVGITQETLANDHAQANNVEQK